MYSWMDTLGSSDFHMVKSRSKPLPAMTILRTKFAYIFFTDIATRGCAVCNMCAYMPIGSP